MAENAVVKANDQAMDVMADEGRVTDDVMAHLTHGEIVIPLSIAHNKKAAQMIAMMFELAGEDISQFIVGSPNQKINPKTGHPEFWGGFIGNAVSSIGNAVSSVGSSVSNAVSKVTSATSDLLSGNLGGTLGKVTNPIVNTVSNVATDIVKLDPVQAVKDTYSGAMKTVAGTMDAVGLLPHPPSVNSPTNGSGGTAGATVTQGDQNQRQQSVTDVQAAAGGGASSLTPRTVAGPDNDYKLNKSAVLGL